MFRAKGLILYNCLIKADDYLEKIHCNYMIEPLFFDLSIQIKQGFKNTKIVKRLLFMHFKFIMILLTFWPVKVNFSREENQTFHKFKAKLNQ